MPRVTSRPARAGSPASGDGPRPPRQTIWYFSYGSNMNRSIFVDRRQMRPLAARCGWLDHHRLCFNLPVGPGERGVANVEPEAGARTYGVLYLLTADECDRLDRTEGVHLGAYQRISVEVLVERTGGGEPTVEGTDHSELTADGTDHSELTADGTEHGALIVESAEGGALRLEGAERVAAFTYRSPWTREGRKPSARYLGLLVEGARQHGLPSDYVRLLERFELAWDERLGETTQGLPKPGG